MSTTQLNNSQRRMVEEHVEFALRVARKFHSQRPDSEFDVEDFEGAALLGLCDAARRFNQCKGMNFRTFAFLRVRGAMLDAVRNGSGIPRRQFNRLVQNSQQGSEETAAESVKAENLPYSFARTANELLAIVETIDCLPVRLGINSRGELEPTYADAKTPEENVDCKINLERLSRELKNLPEKQRSIMHLRYGEDRSFGEIGELLGGLSKSWVSRMHTSAINTVRSALLQDQAAAA
ncbi:MAG: sigma-70 family RNA polymerase sigma factor [Bdellovibrionales bacterium]|nr:sigma-70 family RNA polymerase sigma factor [Bdellovibrionales bacterium]